MQNLLYPSQETVIASLKELDGKKIDRNLKLGFLAAYREVSEDPDEVGGFTGPVKYSAIIDKKLAYFNWSIRSAFHQIMETINVPIRFYERCPAQIQKDIFDHFRKLQGDRECLFRMFYGNDVDKYIVRGVLSNRYTVVDDRPLIETVLKALQGKEAEFKIRNLSSDDHVTRMLIEFPKISGKYNNMDHTAGLAITNSETGHSAVWVEPCVVSPLYHFVNRHALKKQGVECRLIHAGNVDLNRVQEMIEQCYKISQVGIVQLAEAWENKVSGQQAISLVEKLDVLPTRIYDILEEEWAATQSLAKAEIARRILQLAEELPLFQRIPVEQAAGSLTGIFEKYESRINQIMGEIACQNMNTENHSPS